MGFYRIRNDVLSKGLKEKEIWQIPRKQWLYGQKGYEPVGIFLDCSPSQYAGMSKRSQREYDNRQDRQVDHNFSLGQAHENAVLKAYFEGKTIPEEVLKDYRSVIEETKQRVAFQKEQERIRSLPRVKSISEFTGQKLKKELGLANAIKGYENKHVNKSGNFGYILRSKSDNSLKARFKLDHDIAVKAKQKGYDSIALVSPTRTGWLKEGKLPRSVELNVLDMEKVKFG